jgi:hypothetical protein
VGKPSSDGYEAFVPVVLGNRSSLLWPLWGFNGHLTSRVSGVDNTELVNSQPVRSRQCEHGCEEDGGVVSRHRTVLTLKGWGPTVRRIDHDGEENEKSSVYNTRRL